MEKARGPGSAGEVVYWVIRDGLTETLTFEGRPEDVRAGANGCSGRGESKCQGSEAGTYFQETSERPVPLHGGINSSSRRKDEAGTKW